MAQAQIIKALQNGPLTSQELCDLTGMPKSSVLFKQAFHWIRSTFFANKYLSPK